MTPTETPRKTSETSGTSGTSASKARKRKGTRAYVALGAVAVAIGFLLFQGLGNATEYFKTTEEAAAQQSSLGSSRFRLVGIVVEGSVCAPPDGGVRFLVETNGKKLGVKHDGDPPELFRENIPVVLSGAFVKSIARPAESDGPVFASDLVMIKHTAIYIQKNKDRVANYVGKDGIATSDASVPSKDIPACA